MESLWRVETHAHTAPVSPCGRLAPEQLVEQVRAAGYDALFVTDHYTPEFFAVYPTGEGSYTLLVTVQQVSSPLIAASFTFHRLSA